MEFKKLDLGSPNGLSRMMADDKNIVLYRPKLNKYTGGVCATILLQQIMYWAEKTNNNFYKFSMPCNHELYKQGDSWCEELGFSKREFNGAIQSIGFKLGKNKEKNLMSKDDAFVIYYTDSKRLTYYSVNWNVVNRMNNEIYLVNHETVFTKENTKSELTKEKFKNGFTKENTENGFTFNTETTTKITTKTTQISSSEEAEILEAYKNSKGKVVSPAEKKKLKIFIESYTAELVLKAIDETVLKADKFNLAYVESCLKDWVDLEGYEKSKKAKNSLKTKNNSIQNKTSTFNDFKQREYDFNELKNQLINHEEEVLKEADCSKCSLYRNNRCIMVKKLNKNNMCSSYIERG